MNQKATQATPLPKHGGKEAAEQKEQWHAEAMDDVVDFHERKPSVVHRGPNGDAGVGQSSMQHDAQQHGSALGGVQIVATFVHSKSLPFLGANPSGSCGGLSANSRPKRAGSIWFRRLWMVRNPSPEEKPQLIQERTCEGEWIVAFDFPMGIPFGSVIFWTGVLLATVSSGLRDEQQQSNRWELAAF